MTSARSSKTHKGFTLLELVVALVVLAILAGLAIPTFATYISNSKNATAAATLSSVASDAIALASQNGRTTPNSSDITTAMGEVPALSSAGAGYSAAGTSLSWTQSSNTSIAASNNFGNISVDLTSQANSVGLAMKTAAGGCAMAQIVNNTVTSWWYPTNLGLNCNGNKALSGQGQPAPTFGAPPVAPTILSATAGASTLTVNWSAVTASAGSVTGYEVWYSTTANGSYTEATPVASASATSYTISGLTTGQNYYVEMVTDTNGGNSALSAAYGPTKVADSAPGQVTNLTITEGLTDAVVSWSDPTNLGGADQTSMTYTVSEPSNRFGSTAAGCGTPTLSNGVWSCEVDGNGYISGYFHNLPVYQWMTPNTSYTWTITGTNNAGLSSTTTITGTTLSNPDAPSNITVSEGDYLGFVYGTISWTSPTNTGGAPLYGYTATWAGATCSSTSSYATSCNALSPTSSLASTPQVTVYNGNSTFGEQGYNTGTGSSVTSWSPPSQPTYTGSSTAAINNTTKVATISYSTSSAGGDPNGITSLWYKIYSNATCSNLLVSGYTSAGSYGLTGTFTVTNSNFNNSTYYYVQVAAYSGAGASAYSTSPLNGSNGVCSPLGKG